MNHAQAQAIVRAVLVTALVAIGTRAVWWAGASAWRAVHDGTATFDDIAALACACALAAITAWMVGLAFVAALIRMPGVVGEFTRRIARHVVPALVRHALPTVFGATVLATPIAAIAPAGPAAAVPAAQSSSVCSLPAIGRPAAASATLQSSDTSVPPTHGTQAPAEPDTSQADTPTGPPSTRDQVVVAPGDSLWSIAADHLGPDATLAAVAEEWPRWFAANRDEIGPDPDLVQAGTRLVVPSRP